jgi:hypothetical protein
MAKYNDFLEKNRKLLTSFRKAAEIIGWANFIMGIASLTVLFILFLFRSDRRIPEAFNEFARSWYIMTTTGILLLGIEQFINYLYEAKEAGFLLRHAAKILYVLAGLVVWHAIGISWAEIMRHKAFRGELFLTLIIPIFLLNAAKILVLVGLAHIVQRLLPVIEESRTLV